MSRRSRTRRPCAPARVRRGGAAPGEARQWLCFAAGCCVVSLRRVLPCAGKLRNRRYTMRRGPLVVFANDEGISKAFRNLPGVEVSSTGLSAAILPQHISPPARLTHHLEAWCQSALLHIACVSHKVPSCPSQVTSVDRLNLLQLAPGGHLGRFCIWSKSAFEKLDKIFGSTTKESEVKKGYKVWRVAVLSYRVRNAPVWCCGRPELARRTDSGPDL
jgi:hypothetical protein